MSLRTVLRHLMTESDNITHDLYRYLALLPCVAGVVFQALAICKGQPFDMQQFGIGAGALLAGVGIALGLKKESP